MVWKKEELQELAEICADDNVIVFSDEIHADLALPPYQHLPFAMVSEKARNLFAAQRRFGFRHLMPPYFDRTRFARPTSSYQPQDRVRRDNRGRTHPDRARSQ